MKNEKYLPMFISGGLLLGLIAGVILGLLNGDFGLWLSLGVGVGMVLGALTCLFFSVRK
ncbi:hypothetical protein [Algoriphagus sp. AK58]|uniref:hypothetical protein n=1 Tax=Algoriphagus sp. AK58 TaxID=1406877 RepID=UPI00164F0E61|nr:hypothetical protein [Algoriphagus sp. AK58]